MKDLKRICGNKFTYRDVMRIFDIESYEALKQTLDEWVEKGLAKPVVSSGMTAFAPHVYNRYQKIRTSVDYSAVRERIVHLNPKMIGYYMDHPDEYLKNELQIERLGAYLDSHEKELKNPDLSMTVKERSFDIFGKEKYLEKDGGRICSACGITYEDLNCYPTWEPFFCRIISEEGYAVVLENKDPWDSVGRVMENRRLFLGKPVCCLIYGEGNKVSVSDPDAKLSSFMNHLSVKPAGVLYCGDLDKAGVRILDQCRSANQELDIKPFTELYLEMVKKAPADIGDLEDTDDHHTKTYDVHFLDQFEEHVRDYIRSVLDQNKRIPQEILNRNDYRRMCE